jgi:hypothetical protein
MAECVSCGKEIPAGKFFCDDCYRKMKGRRGSLRRVTQPLERKPAVEAAAAPVVGGGDEPKGAEGRAANSGVQEAEKKTSGTLTPTTSKKVVSLKPEIDRAPRGKGKAGKTRFTITITFSERTYMALERLKRKKKEAPAAKPKRAGRKTGPHGRPKLKAVESVSRKPQEKRNYLLRLLKYRDRKWDRGDVAAGLMATAGLVLTLVLSPLPWVRLTWVTEGGAPAQVAKVSGIDLGALVYILIVLAVLSWLYMAVTAFLKRSLLEVDFGVVLLLAGVIFIPIVFITLAFNGHIYNTALAIIRRSGSYIPEAAARYERKTLWPSYFMVLMGCVLAFSGLIRLSVRTGRAGSER